MRQSIKKSGTILICFLLLLSEWYLKQRPSLILIKYNVQIILSTNHA